MRIRFGKTLNSVYLVEIRFAQQVQVLELVYYCPLFLKIDVAFFIKYMSNMTLSKTSYFQDRSALQLLHGRTYDNEIK